MNARKLKIVKNLSECEQIEVIRRRHTKRQSFDYKLLGDLEDFLKELMEDRRFLLGLVLRQRVALKTIKNIVYYDVSEDKKQASLFPDKTIQEITDKFKISQLKGNSGSLFKGVGDE